ncbi:MAG: DUF5683 domain-containing protein [Candidatus Eisenbacteria bacterium]
MLAMLLLAALPAAVAAASRGSAADSTAHHRAWHEQPRFVMARSLVVPGWGQFHNRAWWKAAAVAGGEGLLVARIAQDQSDLRDWRAKVDAAAAVQGHAGYAEAVSGYNATLDRLVGHQWLLGGVVAYALVDAYVDAHFRDFDIEFRTDPALPDGIPPSDARPARSASSRLPGLRAALRWNF